LSTQVIDREKRVLNALAEKYGLDLQHPEVQAQSQKLDKLIIEYQQLLRRQ